VNGKNIFESDGFQNMCHHTRTGDNAGMSYLTHYACEVIHTFRCRTTSQHMYT